MRSAPVAAGPLYSARVNRVLLSAAMAALCARLLAAPAATAQTGDVLVLVNGEPIPRESLEKMTSRLRGRLPADAFARLEREATGTLIQEKLIEQFLRKVNFVPTRAEIDAEIARKKRIYESSRRQGSPSFEEALRQSGASVEQMRESPPVGMRFSCYVRRSMKEEDLLRTFETQRRAFDGTEVRARHVLLDTRAVQSAQAKEALRAKAEELRRRIVAGEDFGEIAKAYSDCPSAANGGDLGYFPRRGRMVEPFAAAAFALDKFGVSPVVETQFGFHIIQVTDIRPGRPVTLDEVRAEVEDVWAESRGREIYEELARTAKLEWPQGRR